MLLHQVIKLGNQHLIFLSQIGSGIAHILNDALFAGYASCEEAIKRDMQRIGHAGKLGKGNIPVAALEPAKMQERNADQLGNLRLRQLLCFSAFLMLLASVRVLEFSTGL